MEVSYLTIARRIIPYLLVNFLLLPLTAVIILVGWGKDAAWEFWDRVR
jgi:hypothetical protein